MISYLVYFAPISDCGKHEEFQQKGSTQKGATEELQEEPESEVERSLQRFCSWFVSLCWLSRAGLFYTSGGVTWQGIGQESMNIPGGRGDHQRGEQRPRVLVCAIPHLLLRLPSLCVPNWSVDHLPLTSEPCSQTLL